MTQLGIVALATFVFLIVNTTSAQVVSDSSQNDEMNDLKDTNLSEETLEVESGEEVKPPSIPTEIMDEIVVTGQQPEFPNLQTFADRHLVHNRGEFYYRTRQYKKAFPYLLASAKQGFKMAQARLGFIYQQGLGEVPRDAWRAMGWLGVAASEDTDPQIRNYYRKQLRKIPEELLPAVEAVVAAYVERYGPDATGMDCIMSRPAGSHIARMACNFKAEFALQDVSSMLEGNSTGAIPVGPTGDLTGSSPTGGN